jgi:hypothetical protein
MIGVHGREHRRRHPSGDSDDPRTFVEVQDALPRVEFETGAVRGTDAGSVRYDLITPIGLKAVAEAYAEGVRKFGAYNAEKGIPVLDLINHAIRHLYLYLSGDRSEDHLGHAGWNVLMAKHSEVAWPDLNAGTLRREGCLPPEPKGGADGQA